MTRSESEKVIAPLIARCQNFVEGSQRSSAVTPDEIRPEVRRVSLIVHLAQSCLGSSAAGEGLEVGSGYGHLLFPMAVLLPSIRWSAIEHPGRSYLHQESYLRAFRQHNCSLSTSDLMRYPLPFPDAQFSVVTFSEVLEHLPVERVHFVLAEISRVIRPGGILIASSPNQASLENRLRLLKGNSILEMPTEVEYAAGTFGHIRLYTVPEITEAMSRHGLVLERYELESNNSGYRGTPNSWRRRTHRMYERLEARIAALRKLGDTWYMVFRKRTASQASMAPKGCSPQNFA